MTANQKARNPWAHLIASLCATLKHRYFESCSAKKPKSALGHPAGSPKSQDGACAVIFQFWVPIFTAPKNNAKEFGIQMSLWGRSNALLKPDATPNQHPDFRRIGSAFAAHRTDNQHEFHEEIDCKERSHVGAAESSSNSSYSNVFALVFESTQADETQRRVLLIRV